MKIYIIRHGKVDMKWPDKCNSDDFNAACNEYDLSDIENIENYFIGIQCDNIYVSHLLRSFKTAQILFPNKKYIKLEGIGEVPLKSFADIDIKLPLWMWNIIGRIQWYINNNRQPEIRNNTIKRADKVIDELETKNENCVLLTHGFFMKTLIKRLKKKGYDIKGQKAFGFTNLHVVMAEKDL